MEYYFYMSYHQLAVEEGIAQSFETRLGQIHKYTEDKPMADFANKPKRSYEQLRSHRWFGTDELMKHCKDGDVVTIGEDGTIQSA